MAGRLLLLVSGALLASDALPEERCGILGDTELNALHFLQFGAAARQPTSKPDQCLRFMHIPKTGGTSIDAANMHLPPDHRAFESMMLSTFQRITAHVDFDDKDLGEVYEKSHKDHDTYSAFMRKYVEYYRFLSPGAGADLCEDCHTPPSRSDITAAYYQEPGCTTFCAVRDPLSRYFSGFRMFNLECDPLSVERRTLQVLAELPSRPYNSNCLYVPQVEFVYGAPNKTASTNQYCQRILHEENLQEELAGLMTEFGRSLALPSYNLMSAWTNHCNMTVDELTPKTKAAVYQYFRADYDAFGYAKPHF